MHVCIDIASIHACVGTYIHTNIHACMHTYIPSWMPRTSLALRCTPSAGGPISAGVHLRTASCLMVLGVHVFGVYGFRDYDHRVLVVDPATPLSCKPW